MPKKQTTNFASSDTTYYIARVAQRISLLAAAGCTVILWATLVSISHTVSYGVMNEAIKATSQDDLFAGITKELDKLTMYAAFASVLAIVITILMMKFLRVRKNEKRLVIDGVVIAGFCLVVSLFCQTIYRYILARVI